jgi:hypothetical protein
VGVVQEKMNKETAGLQGERGRDWRLMIDDWRLEILDF